MKLKVAQVIGLNTDQKAAQVISNSRDAENYFFAVLILSSDDAFTRGRQILSEISDFYFESDAPTTGGKLTATFEEAQKKFETKEFSLLLAAVSGKILYLQSVGEVEVYLKRLNKLSPLLSIGAPNQLISGFLQEGDRLLLSTHSLITFLGEDLQELLKLPLEAFEEEITNRVGVESVEDQGLAALLAEVETTSEQAALEDTIPNLQQEQFEQVPTQTVDSPKFLKNILGFLWQQRTRFPKSNRGRLILALILIAVIASGVGMGVKAKKDARLQADFNQAMQQSKDEFSASKSLSTLNPSESKTRLDRSLEKVNIALTLKPKDTEAQNLKKQIEDESPLILQQFEVSEFPLFLDLDLVKKNFRPQSLSVSSGKMLTLDPVVKTLVLVDMAKKSNQILAGTEQLGDALYASLNGDLAFVYSKDKGILRIDTTNQKVSVVAKKDEEWGEIVDIYSFAGNVYLLDTLKNQIWKYLPTSEGYSDKREYLNKTTSADFANALRMQIESSVYVLKKGGEILRFTRGDKDNFSFEGLPSGVKDPKSFFVSSDTDNLYLLDSGNSRLLILGKGGSYKSQISGEKFAQSSDLVADEKGKKVYLLDGSKIFQVELK